MTQLEFSTFIKDFLQKHFPQFLPSINFMDDKSFHASFSSKQGKLKIWLATYHSEMTIGFEDSTGNSDSHWHLGREEEVEPSDLLKKTSEFLNDILSDKTFIVNKEKTGYHLYEKLEQISQKKSNPIIGIYKWSDL